MPNENNRIQGALTIELRDLEGGVILRRKATNTVVRSGAELLADLLAGKNLSPINGIAVGISDVPLAPPYEIDGLTLDDPEGDPVVTDTVAAIPPEELIVETIAAELKVRISIRSVIEAHMAQSTDPEVDVVNIGEAALGVLSPEGTTLERIYNRVVFDPIPKSAKNEIVLYWEIFLPFGV